MNPNISVDVDVTYVDLDSTTFDPGAISEQPVDGDVICSAPTGSPAPLRKIKLVSIKNNHATDSTAVYLTKNGSPGEIVVSPTFTLLAGEMVHYVDGRGWVYYAATGIIKTV